LSLSAQRELKCDRALIYSRLARSKVENSTDVRIFTLGTSSSAAGDVAGLPPIPVFNRPLVTICFSEESSMSVVTKSIVNADAEARYLSPGELDQIKSFVTSGERRLRIAQVLTDSRERIIKQAGDQLFQKRPDVVSPGGNAYGEEMTATCLRDLDYYLRLVTYGVVSGDVTPIEEIGIVGVREMYKSLGTPIDAIAEGVRAMKSVALSLMSGDDAAEAGSYFDYVVGAMQ
jgi:allophycocyanin alpha subunit